MNYADRIYIAGHQGFLGSSLVTLLQQQGYTHLLLRSFDELDLTNQQAVDLFFKTYQPEYVFLTAARSGGIADYMAAPAQFMYDNLMIQNNVIHAAHRIGVKKLLFYATACLYSDRSPQPISEAELMQYPLDLESQFYALPKLAGLKLCEGYYKEYGARFITCIPVNLFGPTMIERGQGVVPSLIRKFVDAVETDKKEVVVWGSGNQRREILYVDDLASASLFLMHHYDNIKPINIGSGSDFSIKTLAEEIARYLNFSGNIIYDFSKPEGSKQKLLDSSRLTALGWKPTKTIIEQLHETIDQYKSFLTMKSKNGRTSHESSTHRHSVRG
jgi:GDP-L-fucose synthase